MSTQYLNIDTRKQWELSSRDYCPFCAKEHGADCYARHCSSCTEDWLADTTRDSDDGRPAVQTCPNCCREGFGTVEETVAFLSAEGDRIARETAEEGARRFKEQANAVIANLVAQCAAIDERKVSVPDLEEAERIKTARRLSQREAA